MWTLSWKSFFAGAIVALISVAVGRNLDAKAPRSAGSHVLLSPEDYIEIQQLYGMYSRDVDPGSVRAASWMFTKDAIWCSVPPDKVACDPNGMSTGRGPFTGTAELETFFASIRDDHNKGGARHFNSSYVIVGTADGGARGSSYMVTVQRRTKDGPGEISNFGKYEDKLVKTPEGWRIKERVWHDDSWLGSMIPMPASPVPGDARTLSTGAVSKSRPR